MKSIEIEDYGLNDAKQADAQTQRPQKISFLKSLKQGGHLKCLLLTILILGCIAVIIWCRVAQVSRLVINFHNFPVSSREKTSPCDEGYIYIPVAFMVTRYRNGDAYTTSQLYYERVNTRVSASCFVYTNCGSRDISKKLVDLEKYPATKIRFSKGFAFASLDAASDFEEQRMRFFRENERFDEYMEMREGLDLLGVDFQEYMVTFAGKDKLPWYVSQVTFWVFSLLLLSWPLRVIIDSQTTYVHYQVTKLFGSNPAAPSNASENQLSRNSTADSVEMERLIENQLNYAPSYSEAVLCDSSYPFSSSLESGLHMDTFNQISSNHRPPRRHSSSRSDDRELIAPSRNRIPKSLSQPFKPFPDTGRPNFNRHPTPRCSRETPPCYDEALLYSYPLVRYMNLRRSATDRDLSTFRPLRTSWSSLFHWMKRNNETDL
ncbi:transmembrane protein 151B [Nephila pilipes]|uniref:Transmembrane protein 151B n=1 Tax=Nephila pilipes TaxID=299642 RepID=A0A8X6Q4B9_NEPPI|nr:transmembrane protein 151B [Nephila pilipes]